MKLGDSQGSRLAFLKDKNIIQNPNLAFLKFFPEIKWLGHFFSLAFLMLKKIVYF